jgi:hypothetical protein
MLHGHPGQVPRPLNNEKVATSFTSSDMAVFAPSPLKARGRDSVQCCCKGLSEPCRRRRSAGRVPYPNPINLNYARQTDVGNQNISFGDGRRQVGTIVAVNDCSGLSHDKALAFVDLSSGHQAWHAVVPDSRQPDPPSEGPVSSHSGWDPLEEMTVGRLEGATDRVSR